MTATAPFKIHRGNGALVGVAHRIMRKTATLQASYYPFPKPELPGMDKLINGGSAWVIQEDGHSFVLQEF